MTTNLDNILLLRVCLPWFSYFLFISVLNCQYCISEGHLSGHIFSNNVSFSKDDKDNGSCHLLSTSIDQALFEEFYMN